MLGDPILKVELADGGHKIADNDTERITNLRAIRVVFSALANIKRSLSLFILLALVFVLPTSVGVAIDHNTDVVMTVV